MCDPITMITSGASLLSTAIGVTQQMQRAASQRGEHDYLAAQQRNAAAVDEQQARLAAQTGEAEAAQARQKAAQRSGQQQARLAAQGTDLLGSPLDVLGDTAAEGAEDALSLRYRSMRDAWEHRVRGASRQAQARYYETAAGNVDSALGIAKSLIS